MTKYNYKWQLVTYSCKLNNDIIQELVNGNLK
jgi:hypothetical protein